MKTDKIREFSATAPTLSLVDGVLTLSELCVQLQVSAQTIYDLRSQGRGPRGFRVGRELRFRISEIDDWLTRLEAEDDRRHQPTGRHGQARSVPSGSRRSSNCTQSWPTSAPA
jgi:excisionase family DNA binding protein